MTVVTGASEHKISVALRRGQKKTKGMACGLVYQIVWVRMLTHVVGKTATAVGVVLAALAAHFLLARITPVYFTLYEISGHSEATLAAVRFILAFGLVMMPTFLMGGTLPVLARFVVRRLAGAGADLSTLYAINTLGAVAGVLACGFYLIGTFGIHVTVYIAVVGNLFLGLIEWSASRRMTQARAAAAPPTDARPLQADSAAGVPSTEPMRSLPSVWLSPV